MVVVRCAGDDQVRAARPWGARLVARGGPAVLALRAGRTTASFKTLYRLLAHDRPLDRIAGELQRSLRAGDVALFAGGGREEAVRVSQPAEALVELTHALEWPQTPGPAVGGEGPEQVAGRKVPRGFRHDVAARRMDEVKSVLGELAAAWPAARFEDHESDAFVPYSGGLRRTRTLVFRTRPAVRYAGGAAPRKMRPARSPRTGRPSFPEPRSGRFVNPSLWSDRGDAQPRRVAQKGARLVAGRTTTWACASARRRCSTWRAEPAGPVPHSALARYAAMSGQSVSGASRSLRPANSGQRSPYRAGYVRRTTSTQASGLD
jgi:hypothetical protein